MYIFQQDHSCTFIASTSSGCCFFLLLLSERHQHHNVTCTYIGFCRMNDCSVHYGRFSVISQLSQIYCALFGWSHTIAIINTIHVCYIIILSFFRTPLPLPTTTLLIVSENDKVWVLNSERNHVFPCHFPCLLLYIVFLCLPLVSMTLGCWALVHWS